MSGQRFTNARVHEWLTPDLDQLAKSMRSTRVQLNSAALWWFCRKLSSQERAQILGEFVTFQAMEGADRAEGANRVAGEAAANGRRRKGSRPPA